MWLASRRQPYYLPRGFGATGYAVAQRWQQPRRQQQRASEADQSQPESLQNKDGWQCQAGQGWQTQRWRSERRDGRVDILPSRVYPGGQAPRRYHLHSASLPLHVYNAAEEAGADGDPDDSTWCTGEAAAVHERGRSAGDPATSQRHVVSIPTKILNRLRIACCSE